MRSLINALIASLVPWECKQAVIPCHEGKQPLNQWRSNKVLQRKKILPCLISGVTFHCSTRKTLLPVWCLIKKFTFEDCWVPIFIEILLLFIVIMHHLLGYIWCLTHSWVKEIGKITKFSFYVFLIFAIFGKAHNFSHSIKRV